MCDLDCNSYFHFNNKIIKKGIQFYYIKQGKSSVVGQVNFLKKTKNWEENNWEFVEKSKINGDIIKKLINNLKLDLSDDFFISFKSLLKLGKTAGESLETTITELEENNNLQKELFKILLDHANEKEVEKPLIFRLYNPDFVIRAKTIQYLAENRDISYLKYVLPLIEDPDDSVRNAVINWLTRTDQVNTPIVLKKLALRVKKESNAVIKGKLEEILKNN